MHHQKHSTQKLFKNNYSLPQDETPNQAPETGIATTVKPGIQHHIPPGAWTEHQAPVRRAKRRVFRIYCKKVGPHHPIQK